MNNLKLAIIQSFLHWENKEANLEMFDYKIEETDDVDLIILPETFNTGFCMKKASTHAESMEGSTMEWMAKKAESKNAVITGSIMISENGKFYNRLIWMRPDGTYEHYDKRHLFRLAYEQNYFEAGRSKKIVQLKDWNICLNVCYDLRFPAWCRNIENQYDVLLFVANWPTKRITHWDMLLKARAIENLSYAVGCNRIGTDGTGMEHSGNSMVVSPLGEVIKHSLKEEILYASLNHKSLKSTRNRFQFYKDADTFTLDY